MSLTFQELHRRVVSIPVLLVLASGVVSTAGLGCAIAEVQVPRLEAPVPDYRTWRWHEGSPDLAAPPSEAPHLRAEVVEALEKPLKRLNI